MELVKGENLYNLTRRKKLPIETAIRVAQQVNAALEAMNAQGIMHRDIKPENVILTPDGTAKVTDFGIAREIKNSSRHTEPGVGFGSLAYVSPEQMVGKGDRRCDIYALGSTLYFVLTGRDPFPTDSTPEAILRMKVKSPPLAHAADPRIPLQLSSFVARMMHPKEKARIHSYSQIQSALQLALEEVEGSRPAPRRPSTALAIAIAIVAAGALLWWLLR
jgi:serine/threonine-protein kinase